MNHEDHDRECFGVTVMKSESLMELTFFAEIYESDKKRMVAACRRKSSPMADENSFSYVSVGRFYYDISQCGPEFHYLNDGKVVTKFLPRFFVGAISAEVIGTRSMGDTLVEILGPLMPGNEMPEMLSLTKYKSLFPRIRFDPNMHRFNQDKILFIDAEYVQNKIDGSIQLVIPLAAAVAIDGKNIVGTWMFADSTGCEGQVGSKCKSVLKLESRTYNTNGIVEKSPFKLNRGISGFRDVVQRYYRAGYKIVAKGSHIECVILADLGCSEPLTASRRRSSLITESEVIIPGGKPEPIMTEPTSKGQHGTEDLIPVYELGGLSFDQLRQSYFDRLTMEDLVSIYESGYHSLDHHPYYEVLTFAHHYIANKYHQQLYIITRNLTALRFNFDEAQKQRLRALSQQSNSSTTMIIDPPDVQPRKVQCIGGCNMSNCTHLNH